MKFQEISKEMFQIIFNERLDELIGKNKVAIGGVIPLNGFDTNENNWSSDFVLVKCAIDKDIAHSLILKVTREFMGKYNLQEKSH